MLMHNAVLLKMVIFGQGQRQYVDTVDTWSGRFSDIAFRLCATRARFTVAVRVLGAFWSGGGPGKVPKTRETHRPFTPFNGAETDVKSKRPACMRFLLLVRCFALSACFSAPSPKLRPVEVVEKQLSALASGDVQQAFAFASPANKQQTGPWQRFEVMVRQTPAYAPLVQCSSFEVLSALSVSENCWQARVRVRPAGSSSAPFAIASPVVHYRWILSRQSEGEYGGCWMVDGGMRHGSRLACTPMLFYTTR